MPKALVNGLNAAAVQAEGQRSPNLLAAYNKLENATRAFGAAYAEAADLEDIKETAEALIALLPTV